jgi:RHH-type proline utilization regulon transcriptional repressor/proline dehydrogenase/delta 1-pyrroline-5-carboxylate dehydrogenase
VSDAAPEDCEDALALVAAVAQGWDATPVEERAAELLEAAMGRFIALCAREGGKLITDAVNEVREAADFCRYYAARARATFPPVELPSPAGEGNLLSLHGRGVFACISPWNFPLAIFTGQVAAALAAGNAVVVKPAEQTPLVASHAVALLHQAGVPGNVLHLLSGGGLEVGLPLVRDRRVSGVAFTGSVEMAWAINGVLAERAGPIVSFIAETGGQNALIADSTALPEQLVADVVTSAFQIAGQRCSTLRVLFVQEEIADSVLRMLAGAMAELTIGDPWQLATDVGPVIDAINETGYGLTFGIHSRIDRAVDHVAQRVRTGNAYVNRSMIGAVVGVQPFGGFGLSGTGPKAGGPRHLDRCATERTLTVNTAAAGGNTALLALADDDP